MINRDVFKPCLVLYPMVEWEQTQSMMRRLNRFVEKNLEFIRRFMNGATQVELDASDRLLLPKPLMLHAGIGLGFAEELSQAAKGWAVAR